MIGIVDYGAGNLGSVRKAFAYLGRDSVVLDSPEGFDGVDGVVLPGVGSFGFAMGTLRERGLLERVGAWAASGRPLFGICLGLQLLAEGSGESPGVPGFGVFEGTCGKFAAGKVPQIGWNGVRVLRPDPLFAGIRDGEFFYYANSFFPPSGPGVLAVSEYGREFAAALVAANVRGVQFHPEKSGKAGLRLLANWAASC
jgi:imidazole glycerol phosphate synthase glutamine amidotransferase subunit